MKKYILELSNDELEKLIANNSAFYELLYDGTFSDACDYVSEIMYSFPYNYSVSAWRNDYVELPINDRTAKEAVEEWLNDVQKSYCYFSEREEKVIRRYLHNLNAFYITEYDNQEAEFIAWDGVASAQYEAQQTILSRLQNELWSASDMDVLLDECDRWLCNLDKDYYTDEELSHIYVDVPRQVIEAHTEQIM